MTELEAVFSSFGTIVSSSFTGEERSVLSAQGVSAKAREALVVFETAASATDAVSMHGMDLVGLSLSVELQSAATEVSDSSNSKTTTSSTDTKPLMHTLKLENMVASVDEVFEEGFQEDIAEEAATHGPLQALRVTIGAVDATKLSREQFIKLDAASADRDVVVVYLQFHDNLGAQKAFKALNGRHFSGQTIKATLCDFDS